MRGVPSRLGRLQDRTQGVRASTAPPPSRTPRAVSARARASLRSERAPARTPSPGSARLPPCSPPRRWQPRRPASFVPLPAPPPPRLSAPPPPRLLPLPPPPPQPQSGTTTMAAEACRRRRHWRRRLQRQTSPAASGCAQHARTANAASHRRCSRASRCPITAPTEHAAPPTIASRARRAGAARRTACHHHAAQCGSGPGGPHCRPRKKKKGRRRTDVATAFGGMPRSVPPRCTHRQAPAASGAAPRRWAAISRTRLRWRMAMRRTPASSDAAARGGAIVAAHPALRGVL